LNSKLPTYLVVPAAGQSTRFGLDRPKFLLQHPTGVTMLEKAIGGLGNLTNNSGIDRVVIVSTQAHFENVNTSLLLDELKRETGIDTELFYLQGQTSSVVETLMTYLKSLDQEVSIVVKDSDNLVKVDLESFLSTENSLAYGSLSRFPKISAPSKSFMEIGSGGIVTNFIEKRVISSNFSVGLTKFSRSSDVLSVEASLNGVHSELYISDVVRSLMQIGHVFESLEADLYEDWGTLEDWLNYVNSYKTIFVDIDGVLFRNGSRLGKESSWRNSEPIQRNVETLLTEERSGRVQLVFTTARPPSEIAHLEGRLVDLGFIKPNIVAGLFHSKRILVNDFAVTNPYPSASAINLMRNSDNLSDFLR
jgi:choline kinase